jgi:hypothetical protein
MGRLIIGQWFESDPRAPQNWVDPPHRERDVVALLQAGERSLHSSR